MALQHLRSSTASKRPTPAAMSEGQLALNTAAASTGLFFKDAAGALVKAGPVHIGATAPNATPASGGHAGHSVGESWLDTSGDNPVLKIWDGTEWQETAGRGQLNVIHVDAVNGDDTNNGHLVTAAKQTIKAAVAAASAGDVIKVAPGVYQEILPIDVTVANLSILGDSSRGVFVHPTVATETNTMFRCNSGTYISGFVFCGLKASGTRGDNPIDDDPTYGLPEYQGWVAGFYPGAVIRKSPWIENCSNFSDTGIDNNNFDPNNYSGTGGDLTSGPTGGGILVDGSVPDVTSPLRSFIVNEFTQVCLDGPGLLVCNNGYAQAVSFFGLFCHYHAKALSGGQINMEVGTTDFGRYGLIADGKSSGAIFSATANGAATASDVTFAINAPTASPSWFGDATRPAINMLVKIGSDIYPILSSSVNGSGWNVTISRPNPSDRSINLGLINGHANGATVEFFLRSMISTASHTFEYAGAGTNYTALPENGGEPVESNEALALNNGRVWLTSTDQAGKFKVGDTFQVDQQTGYVTIDPNSVAVNIVSDGTPQLGGDLDVLNRRIYTSLANTGLVIEGNGTGPVTLKSGAADKMLVGSTEIDAKVVVNAEGGVRFPDADQSNYVGFQAPATVLANLTWTLPDADGTSGQAITTDGSGALGWSTFLPIGGGALTGDLTLNAQSDLRFADSDSSNWVAFQGPATVASNVTWTLPAADGTSGQVLSTDGSGALSWATAAAGGASVTTSDTAPTSPSDGDLWYDSVGGRLYVYYDDGDTSQWVDAAPQGGGGGATDKIEEGNTSAEVIDTGSDGRFVVTTEGTPRATVDSAGRLLVGTSTSDSTRATNLQVVSTTGLGASQLLSRYTADDGGASIFFHKSRGTSIGTNTVINNGDYIGTLQFAATDGTNYIKAAEIHAVVDSTPGTSDMPGRLVFSTTADGASSPTERMRISNEGNIFMTCTKSNATALDIYSNGASNQYGVYIRTAADQNDSTHYFINCVGSATSRFVVRSNGGIANFSSNNVNLSDISTKKDIASAAGTWDCLKQWEIVNFRYTDQPDGSDLNMGVIAQQVAESCPEVVTVFQEATDDQPEKLGIKEQQIFWRAVKALQEAQHRIETLEQITGALAARITALEAN